MKFTNKQLLGRITQLGLVLAMVGTARGQAVAPSGPAGSLSVNHGLLRVGVSPTLNWQVTYPQSAEDVVDIDEEDNSITTRKKTIVKVRVVGVAFQSGSLLLPARVERRVNGGSWSQIFLGTGPTVKPNQVVFQTEAAAGTRLDFRFQGASDKAKNNPKADRYSDWRWNYPSVQTTDNSQKKIALLDGQRVPIYAPAYDQGGIESFLSPYLESNGVIVNIGPRDVIYLTELSTASPGNWAFDMQDCVLVVTFEDVPIP
jgi:hypothetical protein